MVQAVRPVASFSPTRGVPARSQRRRNEVAIRFRDAHLRPDRLPSEKQFGYRARAPGRHDRGARYHSSAQVPWVSCRIITRFLDDLRDLRGYCDQTTLLVLNEPKVF